MALKQTLAEKYADHVKKNHNSKNSLRELYNMNKSSTPVRRRTNFFESKPITALNSLLNKAGKGGNVNLRMPGYFKTPIKSFLTNNRTASLLTKTPSIRITPIRSGPRSYRVDKRADFSTQKKKSMGFGFLNSLWQIANKFKANVNDNSSELSQFRSSVTSTGNLRSPDTDIDNLLKKRTKDYSFGLHEDPVDESIMRAKELRSSQTDIKDGHLMANTNIEETRKRDELQKSFEQLSLQIAQDFRKELRAVTDTIQNLAEAASHRYQRISEEDIEAMENRILKQNEKFLTYKHEFETKLKEKEDTLLRREAALSIKEKDYIRRIEGKKISSVSSKISIAHSLRLIKSEYDNEYLKIATEVDMIRTAREINSSHGANILQAIELAIDKDAKVLTRVSKILLEPTVAKYRRHSIKRGEAFVTSIKDRIHRCQEFLADYELKLIEDPTCLSELYTLDALKKIEDCFETAKSTIYTKLSNTKSIEREYLEILSSGEFRNKNQAKIKERAYAFVSNMHLLIHREKLLGLLKDIIDLLRTLKILGIRIKNQE